VSQTPFTQPDARKLVELLAHLERAIEEAHLEIRRARQLIDDIRKTRERADRNGGMTAPDRD